MYIATEEAELVELNRNMLKVYVHVPSDGSRENAQLPIYRLVTASRIW